MDAELLMRAMELADTYARRRAFFASHPFTREKDERDAEKAREDARAALVAFLAEHLAGVTASAKPCGAVCRAGQQDGIGCAPDECDRENGTRPLARKDLVMLNAADLSNALRRAFNLGQTYWQQADSESWKQQAKANETQGKFAALVEETVAALGVTEGASAGWKLVPVELTQPMREAWDIAPNGEDDDENMRAGYRAMLAAAPSPAGVPEAVIVQCPGCGEGVAEGMACRRRRGHVRPPDCKASPPREGDPDAYGVAPSDGGQR